MKLINKKHIIICSSPCKYIRQAVKYLGETHFQWVYLGEEISHAIAIAQQIGNRGSRIEFAERLQQTANIMRQPYIDYIGKLSLENNSVYWWVSSLSEKNTFISKTFLHSCYVRVCQNIIDSNKEGYFVLFADNRALRRCLIQNLSEEHDCQIIEPSFHRIFETFKDISELFIRRGWFVAKSTYRMLLARYLYKVNRIESEKMKRGLVLLHTWVDVRSFDINNKYHESYFGDLRHRIRNKGRDVIIVSYIMDTVSYRKTLKKMMQSNENFLVPEAFLNIYDIFRVAVKTMLNIPRKEVYPRLEGIEVSEMIAENRKGDWIDNRATSNLLLYDVIRHWKNAGIPIDTFIYTFENHVWEKVYCIALRKFYPSTRIIGYQHSTVSRMLLNYFFSKDELSILPFPNKVITNGKYPEKLLKGSDYDSEKVVRGGAIRYAYLYREKTKFKKDNTRHVILVTTSAGRSDAAELLWKVLNAFEELSDYQIIIKCHPVMPYHRIAKELNVTSIPKHFIISDRPVGELLKESDILLYTSSTTCIEALSLGIPVLHVESDMIIDIDCLDFRPEVRMSARSPEGIINCVKKILQLSDADISERKERWKQVSSEVFGKVDDFVYDLFLESKRG